LKKDGVLLGKQRAASQIHQLRFYLSTNDTIRQTNVQIEFASR